MATRDQEEDDESKVMTAKVDAALAAFEPMLRMCELAGIEVVIVVGARSEDKSQCVFEVVRQTHCDECAVDMLDLAIEDIETAGDELCRSDEPEHDPEHEPEHGSGQAPEPANKTDKTLN